jgi:hypothetical protein
MGVAWKEVLRLPTSRSSIKVGQGPRLDDLRLSARKCGGEYESGRRKQLEGFRLGDPSGNGYSGRARSVVTLESIATGCSTAPMRIEDSPILGVDAA